MSESESAKERLAYWGYRSVERLGMTLPERSGRLLFRGLGRFAFRALPGVRAIVLSNQAQVLGIDPSAPLTLAAAREAFDLYARYWYDTFRMRVMSSAEVSERVGYAGLENIDRALEAGKGCICAVPHMGNWDVAGRWLSFGGYRVAAVAEELRPRRLFELFLRHRNELGMRIVPLSAGTHVGQKLAGLLSDNWIIALVADRDLAGRGIDVEMFGAKRTLPAGPALLSISTGAPLLVCSVSTTEHGWFVRVDPPLEFERSGNVKKDVAALTRLMAHEFELAISAKPSDWHMFQRAWP